jgi:Flp pilus assembly protein TadG
MEAIHPSQNGSRTTRNGERGNHFLELGLVLIPTMALLFGVVDISLAIFKRSSFQHAAREGVRYAVTYQTMSGLGQDASIKAVVQTNAMGFLAGDSGAQKIAIRYYDPVTLTERTGAGSNAPGNIVEVSVENYNHTWIAPIMPMINPLPMAARSSDRMEGLPTGTSPPSR